VAIDDTLLKRFGPRPSGAFSTTTAPLRPPTPFAAHRVGNSWVVAGVVIEVPFIGGAICLPVLFSALSLAAARPRSRVDDYAGGSELSENVAMPSNAHKLAALHLCVGELARGGDNGRSPPR
jgi:hypothetical protein